MHIHLVFSIVKRDFRSLIELEFSLTRTCTAEKQWPERPCQTFAAKPMANFVAVGVIAGEICQVSFLVHEAGKVAQQTWGRFWANCRPLADPPTAAGSLLIRERRYC